MIKFTLSFQKKDSIRIKIRNQNEKLLNGSEAFTTTEIYLIPGTPLDKVPCSFKVKYIYCNGNRESVSMCVFL